jgi:hypothetical protein
MGCGPPKTWPNAPPGRQRAARSLIDDALRFDHGLQSIWHQSHTGGVEIDWPKEFGRWLDQVEEAAEGGDAHATLVLRFVAEALTLLRELPKAPTRQTETADLKWVRQSRRYPLWRVSHPYNPQVAVRLICWFPPNSDAVVVTLFAGDKARIGDVWYNSVANRADVLIDQWKREVSDGHTSE